MNRAVVLDDMHYEKLVTKARALGQTPEAYVHMLIDAETQTFDEILAPVREGFSSMSDGDLDDLFERARKGSRE